METRKLILIIIFSTSLLFLWDAWQKELTPPVPPQTTSGTAAGPDNPRHDPLPVPGDELMASQDIDGSEVASDIEGVAPSITPRLLEVGEKIHVTTDLVVAEIDTAGGDIRRIGLLKHPSREDKDKPYDLLQNTASHISVAQAGLIGDNLPNHKTRYSVESDIYNYELHAGEDRIVVRLLAEEVDGVQVAKVYTFHRGSYVVDVAFEIVNYSESFIQPFSYFQVLRDDNPPPKGSAMMLPSYLGAAIYTEDEKFQKIKFSDIDKNKAEYPANADNGWIAMVEHYFVTAWLPEQQTPREYFAKRIAHNLYTAGVIVPAGSIGPGEAANVVLPLYAGPQEQDILAELSPGLDLVVDYGWLTVIAKPLFWLLSFYHSWVGNWGVAIILLTLTVKLLFFPLSAAGYRSMAKLRVVTPKLQRIREQYSSDRQRMHQAMMEFYKKEKINPMGGCLPILVQIPVFIALFWTLLAAVELRYAPFALWITDMSVPDPYYILPLLMGVSMWVQSKLSPKPADPIQAKVLQIMPIAFSIFFFFFPSGLVIYSLCNNILSIAQQWQITRMLEKKAAGADKEKIASKDKPAKEEDQLLLTNASEDKEEREAEAQAPVEATENKTDVAPNGTTEAAKPAGAPKGRSKARGRRKKRK